MKETEKETIRIREWHIFSEFILKCPYYAIFKVANIVYIIQGKKIFCFLKK